ncbi:MAG TPA: MBL fold metallo-hydrolase [Spirochaetia bacterium]|nr:MBL fold metallo-hydrolase [Spirochaetia bacterium]
MPNYLCVTCATQFAESDAPPARCPICEDERQYVGYSGQSWITLDELRSAHHTVLREEEDKLTAVGCEPGFAIGQRALLVQQAEGNVLWDCIPLIDENAIKGIRSLGGISAIAISHPHYYSSMVEWSRTFGGVPIYLHTDDREWVMRPDPSIVFWEGETHALPGGITLVRCGGHFEGGTVLHWPAGAEGRGALLSGDIINVVSDRRFVSFMRSYPNLIPLNRAAVTRIGQAVRPYAFDRIYGAWFGKVVQTDAKKRVEISIERYLRAITG